MDSFFKNLNKKLIFLSFSLVLAFIFAGAASAAADVQVNQSVNNTSPNYNQTVKFTTTVKNNGPDRANGVQITTKLPSNLIYVSDDSNGAYNPTTGVWNIGDIRSGSSYAKVLNIIARVNATGTIINLASKTAQTNTDSNLANNAQKVTINIPKATDIKVNNYLWYSGTSYCYSNTPVFVADVRNIGTLNDATNVKIQYIIGNGYEYIAVNTRGVGTATYDSATRTVTWTIPYMPKGAGSTPGGIAFMNVYVRAITTGNQTASLTNTAKLISLDQYDYNSSNNEKSIATTVPDAHDIGITQTYTTYTSGGKSYVTYTINATNNGPNNATGVTISDLLPSNLQWISDNSGGAYNRTTGVWTIGNIANGATRTLTITAEILTTTGVIKNTAYLTAPLTPAFLDWNYNNNAQTTILNLSGSPYTATTNITINQYLWYSGTSYYYNNTPVFVVDVRNKGNTQSYDDVNNVVATYTIAYGYEYIAVNTRGVGTATYDSATRTVTWTIPYMPKGAGSTPGGIAFMNVYVRAITTGNQTASLTNTATLVSPTYSSPRTKSLGIAVPDAHDISVNQTVTGTTNYNNNVTITITATNNGPNDASGVTIKDLLPSNLQWISDNSGGAYNATSGVWTIGNITNGITKTLTIIVKIMGNGTTIQNTAYLTGPLDPAFLDWNYNNNAYSSNIEVPASADIAVTQTISNTTPTMGNNVTITVNAANNGPSYATGTKITDLLPSGLQFVSSTTQYGTFSNGIWTIDSLANGGIATLTIIAKAINVGNYTNTAIKTAENEYDWNTTNDSQSVNFTTSGVIPDDIFTDEGIQGGTVNDDDGTTSAITLPFTVTFYGQTYNTIFINVNGLVSFGTPQTGPYFQEIPNNIPYIAAFWSDIDITHRGSISYNVTSNSVIITWTNVPGYSIHQYDYNNFQIIIRNDGKFGFVYGNMDWKNDPSYWDSYVIINNGNGTNPTREFWNGSQDLSLIENHSIWFNSDGNIIPAP